MGRTLPCLALLIFPAALACGCVVQPGLANAPTLGGTTFADPRVHDAIANGPDSCGNKLDPGPLRYRIIPCPRAGARGSPATPSAPAAYINTFGSARAEVLVSTPKQPMPIF
jgi:hypothetical protein